MTDELDGFDGFNADELNTESTTSESSFDDVNTQASEEANEEPTEAAKEDSTKIEGVEFLNEEEASKVEEKAPDAEATQEEEVDSDGFVLPTSEESTSDEQELSWVELGEKAGITVESDDYDSYSIALQKSIEEKAMRKAEEQVKESYVDVDSLGEEAKKLVKFLNVEGNTIDKYINPLSDYDRIIGLDDENIMTEYFKTKNYSDEQIERQIESLLENGDLDIKATEIRNSIISSKANKEAQLLEEAENSLKLSEEQMAQEREQTEAQFQETLDKTQDFFGIKLDDNVREYAANGFKDGRYDDYLSSPEAAMIAIMYKEFGAQAMKNLGKESYNKGQDKFFNNLANTPSMKTEEGRTPISTQVAGGDSASQPQGFDAWDSAFG